MLFLEKNISIFLEFLRLS